MSQRGSGRPTPDNAVLEEREILDRGLSAFSELGYDGTTVRQLATRLGVSHNFINDRYGSKLAFWKAVVGNAQNELWTEVQQSLEQATGSPENRLAEVVRSFLLAAARHPETSRIAHDEASRDSERLRFLIQSYARPFQEVLSPLLTEAAAGGRVAELPIGVMMFAVSAMTSFTAQAPLLTLLADGPPLSIEAWAEMLAEILINGLLR
ncbi:AcrR family transcriptional regulator [Psychromicrobium silvestre]|uniref:AcrR family transcriptional regulator n=1 Tax=Psychromicrobium silvestre TaxID=1645614 RepID=A0A7Y9S5A2_9MICC|nr:TetR/AcrR family transcriptional regulator [Psychromicrobium silvestre]NYE93936.1 AcrR family transcriptional regulator [Psychromicrobium silvestre]